MPRFADPLLEEEYQTSKVEIYRILETAGIKIQDDWLDSQDWRYPHILPALQLLQEAQLLTSDNFSIVQSFFQWHIQHIQRELYTLHEKQFLNQETLNVLYNNYVDNDKPLYPRNEFNPLIAERLTVTIDCLKRADLFSEENKTVLYASKLLAYLGPAIEVFDKQKMLNNETFLLLTKNQPHLQKVIPKLIKNNLLTLDNLQDILTHRNPDALTYTLCKFYDHGILTHANPRPSIEMAIWKTARDYTGAERTARAAFGTKNRAIQTSEEAFFYTSDTTTVAHALVTLKVIGLFNEKNAELVINHSELWNVEEALVRLDENKLVSQEHFEMVVRHPDPRKLAYAIGCVTSIGATPAYYSLVLTHSNPAPFSHVLLILNEDNLLDEENLNKVRACQHIGIIERALCELFKSKINLTQTHIDDLLKLHPNTDQPTESTVTFPVLEIVQALRLFTKEIDSKYTTNPQIMSQTEIFKKSVEAILKDYNYCIHDDEKQTIKLKLTHQIMEKAAHAYGTNSKPLRILADIFLSILCLAGVGLVFATVKKHYTGHAFFFFGHDHQRDSTTLLHEFLTETRTPHFQFSERRTTI